ncbi:alanine racemase [Albimonas pacifica]|nr:alanine racemase [Albimonas pacifica]
MAASRAATAPVLRVDLDAIRANWAQACRLGAPGRLSAVLKADAYGLGLAPVARALAEAGCAAFWVNDLDEAQRLLAVAPGAQAFCLMGLADATPAAFAALGAIPALVSLAEVEACARWAAAAGRPMRAALQLDTGLGRLGLSEAEAARLAAEPERLAGLELAALVSHLAAYNLPDDPGNAAQLALLERLACGLPRAVLSLSASSGLFLGPEWRQGLARVGSALFGTQTSVVRQPGLRPCYSLEAPVIAVAAHPAGRRLGYRGAGELSRPSRIATIAAGYADGLPQVYAEAGRPHVQGRRVAVVGGVAMNLTMLDVTDLPEAAARPGARAVLLDAAAPVEPVAEAMACAPNVLLTQVGAAVRKEYLGA